MKFHPSTVCTRFDSPMGPMIAAASSTGLAGLWFDDQRHFPNAASAWPASLHHPVLVQTIEQLHAYFAGTRTTFDLPLDLQGGTAFQQAVWQALLTIPPGSTTSYGRLSASIGKPAAVRAVGSAVGRNPVGIIVPCHRVLGNDGSLTGYAGGLHRKTTLLELEGVPVSASPGLAQAKTLTSARTLRRRRSQSDSSGSQTGSLF